MREGRGGRGEDDGRGEGGGGEVGEGGGVGRSDERGRARWVVGVGRGAGRGIEGLIGEGSGRGARQARQVELKGGDRCREEAHEGPVPRGGQRCLGAGEGREGVGQGRGAGGGISEMRGGGGGSSGGAGKGERWRGRMGPRDGVLGGGGGSDGDSRDCQRPQSLFLQFRRKRNVEAGGVVMEPLPTRRHRGLSERHRQSRRDDPVLRARGLLPRPPRSLGGFREYQREHLERPPFIRRARALGFALNEVRCLPVGRWLLRPAPRPAPWRPVSSPTNVQR